MSNKIHRIAKSKAKKVRNNNNVCKALFDYVDYFVVRGAKRIDINTKNGFSIAADVVLNEEEINSKEFQGLVVNLYNCLSA